VPALKGAINSVVPQLGFRYFDYRGYFPGSRTEASEIRMDTCPPQWRDHCLGQAADDNWDPLHRRALDEVAPILWSRLKGLHPTLFAKARQYGLATGVTVPIHAPGGQWSSISFVKDRSGARAEREIQQTLPHCLFLTSLVNDAATRIIKRQLHEPAGSRQRHADKQPGLSERERECLSLAALGNTMREIADVLPITERTVAFHLANARRKLGVASLRHAVTRAASMGLVNAR
jgi:DNA-binding CsgD family transcriptional regulator